MKSFIYIYFLFLSNIVLLRPYSPLVNIALLIITFLFNLELTLSDTSLILIPLDIPPPRITSLVSGYNFNSPIIPSIKWMLIKSSFVLIEALLLLLNISSINSVSS